MSMSRYIKIQNFPQKHKLGYNFTLSAKTANKQGTLVPIIRQDEALGDPSAKYTNPKNPNFLQTSLANCYPESRINSCRANLEIKLRPVVYATDNVNVLKVGVFGIVTSFLENLTPVDEVSQDSVEAICQLTHETTDKQVYPIYNGTDLAGDLTSVGDTLGLTTDDKLEGVDFDLDQIYDAWQYYSNKGVFKKSFSKIKWVYVSRDRIVRMSIRLKSKAKRMNEYTSFHVGVIVPAADTIQQPVFSTDLSASDHIDVTLTSRYNEWNDFFNPMR